MGATFDEISLTQNSEPQKPQYATFDHRMHRMTFQLHLWNWQFVSPSFFGLVVKYFMAFLFWEVIFLTLLKNEQAESIFLLKNNTPPQTFVLTGHLRKVEIVQAENWSSSHFRLAVSKLRAKKWGTPDRWIRQIIIFWWRIPSHHPKNWIKPSAKRRTTNELSCILSYNFGFSW